MRDPKLAPRFPVAIAVRERVCKSAGPNDGLALNRYCESP